MHDRGREGAREGYQSSERAGGVGGWAGRARGGGTVVRGMRQGSMQSEINASDASINASDASINASDASRDAFRVQGSKFRV